MTYQRRTDEQLKAEIDSLWSPEGEIGSSMTRTKERLRPVQAAGQQIQAGMYLEMTMHYGNDIGGETKTVYAPICVVAAYQRDQKKMPAEIGNKASVVKRVEGKIVVPEEMSDKTVVSSLEDLEAIMNKQ